MNERPEEPRDGNAGDRVAPIPGRGLHAASDLLFNAYRSDPTFARLYDLAGDQLVGTMPIFKAICAKMSAIPDTTLGCYRAGKLVGVVTYLPDLHQPMRHWLARAPVTTLLALVRNAWVGWRCRPRLGTRARARWRTYVRLAREQAPKSPCLHILALGVVESARRSGVARQLLAAVETDKRWQPRFQCSAVETWHPTKVSIYERLGFETIRHGVRDGVECWTMVRPAGRGGP